MHANPFKQTLLSGVVLLAFATGARAQDATPNAPAAAPAHARADLDEERREMDQLREQMRELSRKMADLSMKVGDVGPREYAWRYIGNPDSGMVGVVLDSTDQGLRVKAVTPGGPADKAGIRNNDIIVGVNGKSLATDKRDEHAPRSTSLGELKVDQSVTLSVQRDGKTRDYTLKAERRDPYNFAYAFNDNGAAPLAVLNKIPADLDKRINEQTERAMREAQRAYAKAGESMQKSLGHLSVLAPWWGLNLASLNPDLAAYFGTDKGALVLSADEDGYKQLKSGDVLQQIAGRKVERPEDALRLLREQPADSEVKVDVLRQHKPMTLTLRAPQSWSVFVPPPPPPAPPAPPAPPTPPAPPAAPAPPAPPAPPPPHTASMLAIAPVVAVASSMENDEVSVETYVIDDADDTADSDGG